MKHVKILFELFVGIDSHKNEETKIFCKQIVVIFISNTTLAAKK